MARKVPSYIDQIEDVINEAAKRLDDAGFVAFLEEAEDHVHTALEARREEMADGE